MLKPSYIWGCNEINTQCSCISPLPWPRTCGGSRTTARRLRLREGALKTMNWGVSCESDKEPGGLALLRKSGVLLMMSHVLRWLHSLFWRFGGSTLWLKCPGVWSSSQKSFICNITEITV